MIRLERTEATLALAAHIRAQIESLRDELEVPMLPEARTQFVRGRLIELRDILERFDLPNP